MEIRNTLAAETTDKRSKKVEMKPDGFYSSGVMVPRLIHTLLFGKYLKKSENDFEFVLWKVRSDFVRSILVGRFTFLLIARTVCLFARTRRNSKRISLCASIRAQVFTHGSCVVRGFLAIGILLFYGIALTCSFCLVFRWCTHIRKPFEFACILLQFGILSKKQPVLTF